MKKLLLIALLGMMVCAQVGCQSSPLSNVFNGNAFAANPFSANKQKNNNADFASYSKPLPSREELVSNSMARNNMTRNNLANYPLGYRRGNQPCST